MLRLTDQSRAGSPLSFDRQTVRIGRVEGNDLVLPVSHISTRHAQIRYHAGNYLVSDLGSTNGSFVEREGQRLLLGAKGSAEIALQSGDTLVLGDVDNPVRLDVHIEQSGALQPGGTIVAARNVGVTAAELTRRVASGAGDGALAVLFDLVDSLNTVPGEKTPGGIAAERERLLGRIAEAALRAIPGAADAMVVVREGDALVVRGAAHHGDGISREPNAKLCQQVFDSGEALLFGNESAEVPAATLVARGVGNGIAAPLWRDQRAIGVLQINCARADLGEVSLDLAAVLAHHAAAALERADLIGRLRAAEAQLREENAYLKRRAQPSVEMIAESPASKKVIAELERAARADVTVLLSGETGTGKEVAARFLHAHSRRADGLLVPVNCGALSETLLDSELFGHRKGAFTGAASDRKGVFEMASGGTVFLDEIGETPAAVQVRLLRVLEEGRIKRVGEATERSVNVRVVAATNRDLARMVDEGTFRKDLYYRLRVFPVRLPPLRERTEDIAPLARAFVQRHAEAMGRRIGPIDASFIAALERYAFPGNVRELVNETERAVVRVDNDEPLTADLLSEDVLAATVTAAVGAGIDGSSASGADAAAAAAAAAIAGSAPSGQSLREMLASYERQIIERVLARHGGRKVAAAQELGLTRQGLAKKMDRLGISG